MGSTTNKLIYAIGGTLVLVIVLFGVYSMLGKEEDTPNSSTTTNTSTTTVTSNDSIAETDTEVESEADNDGPGEYITYTNNVYAKASDGDVVLFFHASWCPTCKVLNTNIENSLNDIPSGLTIVKTDYDTYTELKKKYGVTYQHTLVQVDENGNQLKKWSGSYTLDEIKDQLV